MNKKQNELEKIVDTVEKTIETIENRSEEVIRPVRRTLFKRFPITFILIVAFGVSAIITASELLFMKIEFFVKNPVVLLFIGLTALAVTGKFRQKLG